MSDNLGTVLRLPQCGRCVPPLLYIVRRGAIRQVTNLGGSIVLNCGALQINSFPLFTSQCAHAGFIGHAAGAFDLLESHLLVISFVVRKVETQKSRCFKFYWDFIFYTTGLELRNE